MFLIKYDKIALVLRNKCKYVKCFLSLSRFLSEIAFFGQCGEFFRRNIKVFLYNLFTPEYWKSPRCQHLSCYSEMKAKKNFVRKLFRIKSSHLNSQTIDVT